MGVDVRYLIYNLNLSRYYAGIGSSNQALWKSDIEDLHSCFLFDSEEEAHEQIYDSSHDEEFEVGAVLEVRRIYRIIEE